MLIVQLTDLHVAAPGQASLGGADSAARAAAAARWLEKLAPRPDLLLLTGDIGQRGDPAEYAEIRRLFANAPCPVRAIPGNHDARDAMRAELGPAGWLEGMADGPFLHGVAEMDGLTIILLDTVQEEEIGGEMCPARLDWLADRLRDCAGRPTLLALHHPPFDSGVPGMDEHGFIGRKRLTELAAAHAPHVVGAICGHLHGVVARPWAGTMGFAAPSAGRQFVLSLEPVAKAAWSNDPPAATLHQWYPGGPLTSLVVSIPQT